MKDREATALMRALAERQHGVFSTWQLLDHGISERTVHSRRTGDCWFHCIRASMPWRTRGSAVKGELWRQYLPVGRALCSRISVPAGTGASVVPMALLKFSGSRADWNRRATRGCDCTRPGASTRTKSP